MGLKRVRRSNRGLIVEPLPLVPPQKKDTFLVRITKFVGRTLFIYLIFGSGVVTGAAIATVI